MHLGVAIATDYAIPIDELARETEARGFESLWVPEHTHIPTSRRSPVGGGRRPAGGRYRHTYDPFISLMLAAAVTKNLKLGTGICLIIERDTIHHCQRGRQPRSGSPVVASSLASAGVGMPKRWNITAQWFNDALSVRWSSRCVP